MKKRCFRIMMRLLFLAVLLSAPVHGADFNAIVLSQLAGMPQGGGYATTTSAHDALASAVSIEAGQVRIRAQRAMPSYCSGATYLVFLKALGEIQRRGLASISREDWQRLAPQRMKDGEGVWGRWNANGPGTPRLFHELGLGSNFTSFAEARPGDFLKIFWTTEVGQTERGHSVVFLGTENRDGVEYVKFWSSNKPGGYGEKSVPRSKIAQAIFSRLEHPEAISRIATLPPQDTYLASLLAKRSSFQEAKRLTATR